ncbi:DUF2341 domain-containing protein [Mucilaginibacter sp.]|uniref:DUF2341 domain-containing protein n=1 Tax=Mucilaginibacter sp. TaxID=1882438 RepID=UPI0025FFAB89|nr:DUF2341 domain-containing protein [Mucilaginibacter sp.]
MRLRTRNFFCLIFLLLCSIGVWAQPNISYTPSSNIYTSGAAISTLNISNSGTAVSAFSYGTRSALGGTPNGPANMTTDASGNIYVANYSGNIIKKYSSAGVFISNFISGGSLNGPVGQVFDSSGNLYVLNYNNGRVLKYNSSGTLQSTIITGYTTPLGIAIDASDNLYIADNNNNRVRKYSTSGTLLQTITSNVNAPSAINFDSAGNMFVLNSGGNNVTKYNSAGTYQSTLASGFNAPLSMTIDEADNVYVGDSGNSRIRIYNSSGTLLTTITGMTDAEGLAVDALGDLYASDYTNSKLYKYPPIGGYFINTALPAGLSFSSSTGAISGTPTVATPATTYTVTAYNASGSDNTTVTITVMPPTPAASGGGTGCSLTLTASGGSPAGGTYNWYNVSTGGSALATGTTYLASPGTYYVSYTYNTVESSRSTGTTVTAGTSPILATAPTGSGLYLSYPFNGNANDASTAGNNGTVQNSATLTTDRYGAANSAYTFNGSTQYISTATASAAPGPQNFSISVWFKTSSAGGMLVGYGSSQTGASAMYDRHIYMTNAGQIYYGIYPSSVQTISTATSYADGNWHHAVATTSTTAGSYLFVDGAVVAADNTMTTSQNFGANGYWRVGYDNLAAWTNAPTNPFFNGSLDDVAVYNTALTASQVYTLYGAGSPPTCIGSSLLLQANTVAGATYSWSGPGGYTSSSQNPTVTASASAANAGTYTLTVTNASGCVTTTTVTAVVNTLPVTTFTATTPVTTSSNSTVTYTGTYLATSTYSWNFGGGTIVSGSGVGPYTINWSTTGTKTITLTVTNAAGCSSSSTQNVVVSLGNYGNYGFKKTVTLNTTTLGITSNLTNFPALLSIQDNNLIIASSCTDKVYTPNGPNYDFAFVDATGAELNYQIESYNQTTGTLLVWVKIPTLTYATNNGITFYYGSLAPTVTHNTAFFQGTWASDYQAVYHFNESTYTGTVTDGSASGNTGTASGMSSSDLVTGKIGTAYTFASGKKITATTVNVAGTFTISAWVKPTTISTDQKIMTNQAASGSGTGGYKLGIYSDNKVESESGIAITRGSTPVPPAVVANTWYYVQGVFNGSTLSTYINGTQYAVLSTTTAPTSTTSYYIGVGEGGNVYYFNGLIDEARVSNVAKSTDWLKAEYVNQGNPVSFTTSGATTVISANAAAVPGALTYTWKGGSTNPTTASNWDNTTAGTTNQLPAFDGTATLVIPTGLSNYPSLTANASLFGLTIASGASFNLNGYTLSVGCNIYNSSGGQILYGTNNLSSIIWNGTQANQTYTGTNTSNTASLGSMTINNTAGGTVTIGGGPVDIYQSLTITQGNLAVGASPAALTLKSTATQTAYVAVIPSGSSITGTVKVERYITGGVGYRGYRLISSPVYAATVSSNNVYDLNYLISGMYLTGTTGTAGGFDKTGNPSLYLFREDLVPNNSTFTSGNFIGISKINNALPYNYYVNGGATNYNIPVGNGVMVFFRGNRAAASLATETVSTYTAAPTVTLTSSGTLNQGQITVHDWYTPASANLAYTGTGSSTNYSVRGYNLVGNPYASSIDWETFNTTSSTTGIYGVNIGNTIWEFNATLKRYSTYQKGGASTNNGINVISSGQGFYVQASATSPQLIFNESAKTPAQNVTTNYFEITRGELATVRSTGAAQRSYMRLQLSADSLNAEDIYIGLDHTAKRGYVFDEDAVYKSSTGLVSLASISADNVVLAINKLSFPQKADTIKLKVNATSTGQYHLDMTEFKNIPSLYEVWLKDAYKKDSLDIKHNPNYVFDIMANDTTSFGSKRFSLIIRQNPALALHLLNFAGTKSAKGAELNWTTENEENYTNFTIERSSDGGKTYVVAGGYPSSSEGTYSLLDKNPPIATDWYRLKLEDLNGTVTYSKPIQLMYSNSSNNLLSNAVNVYPNPATSVINVSITPSLLQLQNAASNNSFAITITGSNGVVVKNAVSSQTDWQGAIGNLLPGSYIVQVINKQNQTVVGKSKFVKL